MNNLGLSKKTIGADLVAGVVNAVTSIPDALGSAVLAGLNPIHGLYAIMVGTPVGALTTGSACAIAVTGLVQGAGVGRNYANPDGDYPETSQDFSGQGVANIVAGFFQGMPVGGSLSSTAINVSAGARTRWASISAGIFALVFVLLFAGLIEQVVMPCVAALLIVAGVQAIDWAEMADVRDAGWMPRLIMVVTFVITLFLPIQQAVFFGVVLSTLLFVYRAALLARLWELNFLDDGRWREQPAPEELPSQSVTVLQFYGTTFFGAAYTLEKLLPSPQKAKQAVVVLRLRGHEGMASTFIGVLERYAERLQASGGKLVLSGVSESVWQRLLATETTESIPQEDVFLSDDFLGSSTRKALEAAALWIEREKNATSDDGAGAASSPGDNTRS